MSERPSDLCGGCDGMGLEAYENEGAVCYRDDAFCGVCGGTGKDIRDPMRPLTWLEAWNERIEQEWGWMRQAVKREYRYTREEIIDCYSDNPQKLACALRDFDREAYRD